MQEKTELALLVNVSYNLGQAFRVSSIFHITVPVQTWSLSTSFLISLLPDTKRSTSSTAFQR